MELDLVLEDGRRVVAVEAKSGATVAPEFFRHLEAFGREAEGVLPDLRVERRVVYGGDAESRRKGIQILPWEDVQGAEW